MSVSTERRRRNQETFKQANERIDRRRQDLDIDARTPWVCECFVPECTELVLATPAEYDRARENDYRYIVVPGHEHGEALIETSAEWSIVEKGT